MPTITRESAASFRRPLVRPEPVGPVQAYKTYAIVAPLDTHWRTIGCDEAGCSAMRNGWKTSVDESTDLGQRQAGYIRFRQARPFTETREAGITVFTFPAGVTCFTRHQSRRSRPPLFVVRNGDHRANLGTRQVHSSSEGWIDDFASHQDRLARVRS